MYTIHLHNLLFFSHHGIHEEERILGNWFEVNVDVKSKQIQSVEIISDSIDYVEVYNIIKVTMNQPTALLEKVAENTVYAIHQHDPRITEIDFTIKKMYPPVNGFMGNVGITLHKTF